MPDRVYKIWMSLHETKDLCVLCTALCTTTMYIQHIDKGLIYNYRQWSYNTILQYVTIYGSTYYQVNLSKDCKLKMKAKAKW